MEHFYKQKGLPVRVSLFVMRMLCYITRKPTELLFVVMMVTMMQSYSVHLLSYLDAKL